jgi:hypothetical protein
MAVAVTTPRQAKFLTWGNGRAGGGTASSRMTTGRMEIMVGGALTISPTTAGPALRNEVAGDSPHPFREIGGGTANVDAAVNLDAQRRGEGGFLRDIGAPESGGAWWPAIACSWSRPSPSIARPFVRDVQIPDGDGTDLSLARGWQPSWSPISWCGWNRRRSHAGHRLAAPAAIKSVGSA